MLYILEFSKAQIPIEGLDVAPKGAGSSSYYSLRAIYRRYLRFIQTIKPALIINS